MKKFITAVLICMTVTSVNAQEKEETPLAPTTKLEAFAAKTGTVLVRGYTSVGKINGMGSVTIDARELRDASNPKAASVRGISVHVGESTSSRYDREHTSFIDYDEIGSLLKGIDYISKIDKSITELQNFEASYRTKGDFVITTFNSKPGVNSVSISSGRIGKATAFLSISELEKVRALILEAQKTLSAIKP